MGWFGFGGKKGEDEARKSRSDADSSSLQSKISSMTEQAADAVIPDSVQDIFTSNDSSNANKADMTSVQGAMISAKDQAAAFRRQLITKFKQADDDTQLQYLLMTCTGTFVAGMLAGRSTTAISTSLRRLSAMTDLATHQIGPTAPYLKGRAVRVSDGDTIRFYHVPTMFHASRIPENVRKVSDITLPIRVCTIDTPETAKFGKSGQAFGEEAKQQLQDFALDQMIQIQILTLDQYGRGVAQVRKPSWLAPLISPTYADEMMLKAGLAEVYRGSGAVYGHKGLDAYVEIEEEAQRKKRGMWAQENRESAAEYKRRTKAE
mmetsp:Transcript_508/g.1434  ORF Transcript_508/g.1434 Transcript_508/m.1434 type:complete len:319 (-) Transcript_508:690-1646(-)